MRKYFVCFTLNDSSTGRVDHQRQKPICGIDDILDAEQEIASALVRNQNMNVKQLPLRITQWQKFEQPE